MILILLVNHSVQKKILMKSLCWKNNEQTNFNFIFKNKKIIELIGKLIK